MSKHQSVRVGSTKEAMRPTLTRRLRQWHRGLLLVAGVQLLAWALSGFYMVVVDLDFIHGDHLVRNTTEPLPNVPLANPDLQGFERIDALTLKSIAGTPVFLVQADGDRHRFDASSGALLPRLDEYAVLDLARHYYQPAQPEFPAASASLLISNPPSEIPPRILPVWRVDLQDRFGTSLYIHPVSGELLTRRHDYWRVFDFLWMLHIMDYEAREDIHNLTLRGFALLALAATLAGLGLLYFRLLHLRLRQFRLRRSQEVNA